MTRWMGLLFLTACFAEPTGERSQEERVTGFWSLTVRSATPERIDLLGEVRIAGDMRGWYRLALPRPIDFPPCDPAEVRLQENSDSVIVILWPDNEFLRRELRGILRGDRIGGRWAGPITGVWARLQSSFLLQRIEQSSGLTSPCDG